MKQNLIIVALTLALLLGAIAQVVHLHRTSEAEVLSYFQENQLDHAHYVVAQVKSFFEQRLRVLGSLSLSVSFPYGSSEQKSREIQTRLKQLKASTHVEEISIYNTVGTISYSTDNKNTGSAVELQDFFNWAKQEDYRGNFFVSPLPEINGETRGRWPRPTAETMPTNEDLSSVRFFLAVPLYREGPDFQLAQSKREFIGALSLIDDIGEFLVAQLRVVDAEMKSHQLWIMDRDGTLLFQSLHGNMVGRSIFKRDPECLRCHSSFDHAEKILGRKEGTISYRVGNDTTKLAAFAPVEVGNRSWIIVMTSDYEALTAFSRRSLKGHLALLGILVFALIGGSFLMHRNYQSTVRTEEELKHLRERQTLENRARQSEERYRTLVENMNDGLGVLDEKGIWTYVNDRLCDIVGYSREEMVGRPITTLLDGMGQDIYQQQMMRRQEGFCNSYEISEVRKDGQKVFVLVSPKPIFDEQGQFKGSFAVITDITELKRQEEALRNSEKQLRDLSFQLLTAQEKERRRISRELHDELGQSLAVLKLRLRFLERNLKEDQGRLKTECEESLGYIDQVLEEVRRLSRDLSPSVLEDLGLSNGLRWLINNFVKSNTLKIDLDIREVEIDQLFPQDVQIIIYRILQEAITNIEKHAQASRVSVTIQRQEKMLSFSVEDDGRGFDVVEVAGKSTLVRGLGLTTMQERVRMLSGSIEVRSQKGKGTRIAFCVPAKEANL